MLACTPPWDHTLVPLTHNTHPHPSSQVKLGVELELARREGFDPCSYVKFLISNCSGLGFSGSVIGSFNPVRQFMVLEVSDWRLGCGLSFC
ncbi:hypothetical protein V6N13_071722 [Hibiscus sabdariffa]